MSARTSIFRHPHLPVVTDISGLELLLGNLPRALIFAHFDPDGQVDPHVVYALQSYREYFDKIVFVSTAPLKDSAAISPFVDKMIRRPNVGFDFCSWKAGLRELDSPGDFFEVIFCNDSIYGPIFDLEQALLAPSIKDADFWGMSQSWQLRSHIQSYFFSMRYPLFRKRDGLLFWDGVRELPDKTAVIHAYELTMADWFRERGYNVKSVFNADSAVTTNPTLLDWRQLLIAGVPYVKVELLRTNPHGANEDEVFNYISKISKYSVQKIKDHIARTKPKT
jgi:lipopolysaccharide biosynthesis protein